MSIANRMILYKNVQSGLCSRYHETENLLDVAKRKMFQILEKSSNTYLYDAVFT